jgi:L-lactate dehydrogenase complex protein LldG
MSTAREEILGRIRAATKDVPPGDPLAWDRASDRDPAVAYHRGGDAEGLVERFAERVGEYRAEVRALEVGGDLRAAIAEALGRHGARRIAVPADLPPDWLPDGLELVDAASAAVQDLDEVDGVVTGCALAIGETGTIVLDGGEAQGPRRLTLLPDLHVCVVRAGQIVPSVPEAIAALQPALRAGHPVTFISGPSATSDIELERVEGVHGPRRLEVLIA